MKMQNTILDLASTQISASNRSRKLELPGDRGQIKFNNYLKDSMNRKTADKPVADETEKSVNTFRQVVSQKPIKMKNVEKAADAVEKEPLTEVDTDEEAKVKEEAVLQGMAEIFGISSNNLKQMLDNLGIKPSELTDSAMCPQAVSKLSEVLGLNQQQQMNLQQVLGEINAAVDAVMTPKQPVAGDVDRNDWVKVEGLDIEVVNNTKPDLGELAKVLEDRIHSIVNRLQSSEGLSLGDIASRMKQLMSEISLQKRLAETEQNKDLDIKKEVAVTEQDEKSGSVEAEGIQAINASQQGENVGAQSHNLTGGKEDLAAINAVSSSELQKTADIARAARTHGEIRVVRNEIMTQVVEKAKVMLDGHKSEMVMELRPESLGKLALKVVTENGIVMAKFVAENQQVKEVLESNMQLLKDTLEKQGLSIQGFSVSVGQDSDRGYNMQQHSGRKDRNSSEGSDMGQTVTGILTEESLSRINPYEVNDSNVDFKA